MLITASTEIVFTISSYTELAISFVKFYDFFTNLINIATDALQVATIKQQILNFLKDVSLRTVEFLSSASSRALEASTSNIIQFSIKYQSLFNILDCYTSQNEYQDYVKNPPLDYPTSDAPYTDLLKRVNEKDYKCEAKMTSIASYIEHRAYEEIVTAIKGVSMLICEVINASLNLALGQNKIMHQESNIKNTECSSDDLTTVVDESLPKQFNSNAQQLEISHNLGRHKNHTF